MKKPTTIKNETNLRHYVHVTGEECGYHVSHIESGMTAKGIPDLNLHRNGIDLWLELKIWKDGFHMRPPQRLWHKTRAKYGGKSWVLAFREGFIYCHSGPFAAAMSPRDPLWFRGEQWEPRHLPELLSRL